MVNIEYVHVVSDLSQADVSRVYEEIVNQEGLLLGEVVVVIGTDEWLLEYNRKYLEHDYFTDIITFDYSEGKIIAGDLLISLQRVEENANKYDVPRETELNRVVIHGFLHLCGYDDKTKEDRKIMRKKEDYYLKLL